MAPMLLVSKSQRAGFTRVKELSSIWPSRENSERQEKSLRACCPQVHTPLEQAVPYGEQAQQDSKHTLSQQGAAEHPQQQPIGGSCHQEKQQQPAERILVPPQAGDIGIQVFPAKVKQPSPSPKGAKRAAIPAAKGPGEDSARGLCCRENRWSTQPAKSNPSKVVM